MKLFASFLLLATSALAQVAVSGTWTGDATVHGQQVLMVVMTEHRPSYQDGINLVQSLAQAVEPAIAA